MSPLLTWAAHKCVIRGELIRLGAKKKREAEKEVNDLVTKISNLEAQHKRSMAINVAAELLELRKQLQSILHLRAKKILFFRKGFFYEHSDKTGKFLARALKETQLSTNIMAIKNKNNQLIHETEKIAQVFHNY